MQYIDPDRAQFGAFAKMQIDGPVHMLNLVKFRDRAAYDDDREASGQGISGKDAYAAYGEASAPIFRKVGGRIAWSGSPLALVIGPQDEEWDTAFIAEYPSKDAFLSMIKDPDYQAIVHHRQAAVLTSRLYAFAPKESVDGQFA